MQWPGAEDDAVRAAAAALVAHPVDVYPALEDVPDERRLRGFGSADRTVDRVGYDTDFAIMKRHRNEVPRAPLFHGLRGRQQQPHTALVVASLLREDAVVPMPRQIATASELAQHQYDLWLRLQAPAMSFAGGRLLADQCRRIGVRPSLACYSRLVALAAAEKDASAVMGLLAAMHDDAIIMSASLLASVIAALLITRPGAALAVSMRYPSRIRPSTWRAVATSVLSHIASKVTPEDGSVPSTAAALAVDHEVTPAALEFVLERACGGPTNAPKPPLPAATLLAALRLSAPQLAARAALHACQAWQSDEQATAAAAVVADSLRVAQRTNLALDPHLPAIAVTRQLRQLTSDRAAAPCSNAAVRDRVAEARLQIVSLSKELGVEVDGATFAALLDACARDADPRAVAYFLLMQAAGTKSLDAFLAAAAMFASGRFDAELSSTLRMGRLQALHAYASHVGLLDGSSDQERARIVDALVKAQGSHVPAAAQAATAGELEVLCQLLLWATAANGGSASDTAIAVTRRLVTAVVRTVPAAVAAHGACLALDTLRAVEAVEPALNGLVFHGVPGGLETAAALERTAASVRTGLDPSLPPDAVLRFIAPAAPGEGYVIVLDAAAWACLAADPTAAAAVAKQLGVYARQPGGAALVAGVECALLAPDTEALRSGDRAAKASAVKLLAEWGRKYGGDAWHRIPSLSAVLSFAAVPAAAPATVAPDTAAFYLCRWVTALKNAGVKRVVALYGPRCDAAARGMVEQYLAASGVKPSVPVEAFVAKLKQPAAAS